MELEFSPWLQCSGLPTFPPCPLPQILGTSPCFSNGLFCSPLLYFALAPLTLVWQLCHIPSDLLEWHCHWGDLTTVTGCFLCLPSALRLGNMAGWAESIVCRFVTLWPVSSLVVFLFAGHIAHRAGDHGPIFTHVRLHSFLEEHPWTVARIPGGKSEHWAVGPVKGGTLRKTWLLSSS